jgi:lipopolysaccharide export system permease protein
VNHLNKYILKNLSENFFSIFIPLFVIASVIFLIRVSTITSIIQISLFEMFKLYLFIIPDLLFYTLPLSFFIGGVVTFNKLSFNSEMVVFFSLGIPPHRILLILLKVGFLITTLLLFISLVMIPHTKQMYKEFVKYKQQEAVLNIKATEFGQSFGSWSLFIGSIEKIGKKKIYNNIALYNQLHGEKFIVANKATIKTSKGIVKLYLKNGSIFLIDNNKISKLFFDKMKIHDLTTINNFQYRNTIDYFKYSLKNKKRKKKLVSSITLSFFPLVSTLLILVLGIQNSRYGRGLVNVFLGLGILSYYVSAFVLSKQLGFLTLFFIPIWFLITYIIYYLKIKIRY